MVVRRRWLSGRQGAELRGEQRDRQCVALGAARAEREARTSQTSNDRESSLHHPVGILCRALTSFHATLTIKPVSTRQLNISDFAAHCLEEIEAVQSGDTVLEILSSGGKVIAVINPVSQEQDGGTLGDWVGSGSGLVGGDTSCLDEPTFMDADDAWSQDVWHPLTADQHAVLQKVPAVTSPEALLGTGTEEEWAGFDEALERWRSEQPIQPCLPHAA